MSESKKTILNNVRKTILFNPTNEQLENLFENNSRVYGYIMAKFNEDNNFIPSITDSIWYDITGEEEFPGEVAYSITLSDIIGFKYDWSTEIEVNTETKEVESCSSFSISEDGIESGDGIQSPKDSITWANYHKEIADKFNVVWDHNYKEYIDNWSKGKFADGSDNFEEIYG